MFPFRGASGIHRIVAITLIGGLALGATANAEETGSKPTFTLSETIELGLEQAAPAINALRDEQIAETLIGQAKAQLLPQLKARASYTRLDEVVGFEFDGETYETGREDNYLIGAEISQLLFSGGAAAAAVDGAQLYRDVILARTRAVNNELIRDIRTGFHAILLQDEQVKVQEASLTQLEELQSQAESRYRQETASEFDVLTATVKVANNRPLLIAARKQAKLARAAFRSLIHLDPVDFELVGQLEMTPSDRPLEEWQTLGFEQRPELQELRLFLGVREAQVRIERGGYLPQVRAFGGWRDQNPADGSSLDSWETGWNVGVAAEWDIFDGARRRNAIREAKLELDKTRETLGEAERRVALEIQTQFLDLQQAAETVAASQDTVELAEKSLEIARVRYENGLATNLDFTDANLALNIARLTRLQALHDHMNALARLQQASGEEVPTGDAP